MSAIGDWWARAQQSGQWRAAAIPRPAELPVPSRVLPDELPDNVLMMVAVVLPDGMSVEIAEQLGGIPAVLQVALNAPAALCEAAAEQIGDSIKHFVRAYEQAAAEQN